MPQLFEALSPDQQMIVIRQHAPSIKSRRMLRAQLQQHSFTLSHPRGTLSNHWRVVITSSGNDELPLTFKLPMRRRTPRATLPPPLGDDLPLLVRCHSAVVVH